MSMCVYTHTHTSLCRGRELHKFCMCFFTCIFCFDTKVSISCPPISGRSEANSLFMVEKSATQGLQISNDCYVVPKLGLLFFTLYKRLVIDYFSTRHMLTVTYSSLYFPHLAKYVE